MPYKNRADREAQWARWTKANPDKVREIKRESQKRNWATKKARARAREKTEHEKKRNLAEHRFRFAIRKGWIARVENKHFHHIDYERPYYGAWVTPAEHRNIHAGLLDCPSCVDYTEIVNEQRTKAVTERQLKAARACNKIRWG